MIGNSNRSEQTLTNERLLLLANATQDIIRDWNLVTDTNWWNEAGTTLLGESSDMTAPGNDYWASRIHPDDRPLVLHGLQDAFTQNNSNWSADYRFRRSDGAYASFYDRAYIVYQAGNPVRLLSTIQDTTTRMQHWQVNEARTLQMEAALESAGMGTWHMYPLENRIEWDERCQQLYNWPADQITLTELMEWMHPDDVPYVSDVLAKPPTLRPGESSTLDYRITSPVDHQMRWMRLNGRHYIDEQGVAYYYSGTVIDITEEKQKDQALLASEKRFQELVFQAPMPIGIYVGKPMVIQLANAAILKAWGKDESVIGKSIREALPELEGQPFYQLLDQVYTTGISYQATEDRADLVVDGKLQTFYFNFTYKALRDGDGSVYGVMNMATDVTYQVQARQQIKAAEESLQAAVDLANLGTWQVYPLRDDYTFSDRIKEWLGYNSDDTITLGDVMKCIPERKKLAEATRRLMLPDLGGTLDMEYAVVDHKTGRQRILHSYGRAFYNEQGAVELIVGTSQDVTIQRLTEQELEQQVERRTRDLQLATTQLEQQADLLQGILLNAPTGLYVCEPVYAVEGSAGSPVNFRFIIANPLAAQLVDAPVEAIIGQQITELFTDTVASPLLDLVKAVFADGQAQQLETSYSINGVEGWYRLGISRHGQRIVLINTDITTLKQAEHQAQHGAEILQTMLDGSINGIFLLEPVLDTGGTATDFVIQAANQAVQAHIGIIPGEVIGRTMLDVFPAYKENGSFALYINALRTGRTGRSEYYYQDGRLEGWFDVSVSCRGKGLVLTFSNTTEAKRAQQQLRQLVDDLRRSNDNLQQFAYVASHDLQEPLRKIQSFGSILKTTYAPLLTEQGVDIVERMESAAVRMSTLIKDLLAYSRLTTRQQAAEPQDLNLIVADVMNTLDMTILDSKAIIDADSLCVVPGDSIQLGQLFQNLLTNALKFSRTNLAGASITPYIQIRCHTVGVHDLPADFHPMSVRARYCVIQVIDNGIGFDPKQADRIFGTFQRLHSKDKYPGTGIGLAIAKKVVENHRGYITAESTPGEGATFTVYLPC